MRGKCGKSAGVAETNRKLLEGRLLDRFLDAPQWSQAAKRRPDGDLPAAHGADVDLFGVPDRRARLTRETRSLVPPDQHVRVEEEPHFSNASMTSSGSGASNPGSTRHFPRPFPGTRS